MRVDPALLRPIILSLNNTAGMLACNAHTKMITTPGTSYLGDYMPVAKIGHANFVYVYETSDSNWFQFRQLPALIALVEFYPIPQSLFHRPITSTGK
jgi:hypothetical protein